MPVTATWLPGGRCAAIARCTSARLTGGSCAGLPLVGVNSRPNVVRPSAETNPRLPVVANDTTMLRSPPRAPTAVPAAKPARSPAVTAGWRAVSPAGSRTTGTSGSSEPPL